MVDKDEVSIYQDWVDEAYRTGDFNCTIESREEYIDRQLSLAVKECAAVGCEGRAQMYKTFYKDLHLKGFDTKGLDVVVTINICKKCDDQLHGVIRV